MSSPARIQIAAPHLNGNESKYVQECMDTVWISSAGHFVTDFEQAFAQFCEVEHVIAANNGTTALHLALVALDLGPGDEVIVPTLTYIASANAVTYTGATPVFVDSEPDGMTIDVEDVRRKITPRTKAIMPVHLYGHACDLTSLKALADEHGIPIVEDAAEAHGARADGKRVGSVGLVNSFSFFGNKIMTTGEGGAVTTNDAELAAKLRLLRGQGMDPQRRYWFPVVGYNYRMTNIQAAIGLGQLEKIDEKLAIRKDLAAWYDERLGAQPEVTIPKPPAWSESVNWLYTVRVDVRTSEARDRLIELLEADGIESRPVFYPMHQLPPYLDEQAVFPVADAISIGGISLPTHTQLTESDIDRITERLLHHLPAVRS
ncbi:DegT/DnrJ/EryC1/StrS family aminotransferase [Nakamurella sp. A5-74]|uniref:DegT/DnrJ/EryC1/StrS family aminotransferase n=1 Tax=Nakamurella sp. A5-74 TaxID=3158264 RepID=A0AAU8DMA2_9ACTN